jgi:hypothetical protein
MAAPNQLQKFTRDDVLKHNKADDLVTKLRLSLPFSPLLNFILLSVGHH